MAGTLTNSFLGMPMDNIHHVGLIRDAFEATPTNLMGAELSALQNGYTSFDPEIGTFCAEQLDIIRQGKSRAAEDHQVREARSEMLWLISHTKAEAWKKIVPAILDDPILRRTDVEFTPPIPARDVFDTVARSRIKLNGNSYNTSNLAVLLDRIWTETNNPGLATESELGEDISQLQERIIERMKLLTPDGMQRLSAYFGVLSHEIHRKRMNPLACVAGHGHTDIVSIMCLLGHGFTVVSREIRVVHQMMKNGFPWLNNYIEDGQLVLSPIHEPHPNMPYSLIAWSNPYYPDRGWMDGRYPPVTAKTLVENAVNGAMMLIQTDVPQGFIDPFRDGSMGYSVAWERGGISATNYLMPGTQVLVDTSKAALLVGRV